MKFTIEGAPRTKKNSMRIVKAGARARLLQSRAAVKWADDAILQLRSQWHRTVTHVDRARGYVETGGTMITPQNMRALVYRDRKVGDLLNFLAAVSDALQAAGVVSDDKLIVSLDGSRLLHDKRRPRVEIELLPA